MISTLAWTKIRSERCASCCIWNSHRVDVEINWMVCKCCVLRCKYGRINPMVRVHLFRCHCVLDPSWYCWAHHDLLQVSMQQERMITLKTGEHQWKQGTHANRVIMISPAGGCVTWKSNKLQNAYRRAMMQVWTGEWQSKQGLTNHIFKQERTCKLYSKKPSISNQPFSAHMSLSCQSSGHDWLRHV